jgi:hypothetical protein
MFCTTELAFDSDSGESLSYLNKEAILTENYRGTNRRIHTYKYEEIASPKLTFIKRDFGDFSMTENRAMLSWLTSANTAQYLSIYRSKYDEEPFELLGNFIEVAPYKIANGRTVGYVATFEAATPWAFSPVRRVVINEDTKSNTIVNCSTDEINTYIYPTVIITPNFAEDLIIYNTTIDTNNQKQTTNIVLKGHTPGEIITVDGANRLITSNKPNRIIGDGFNWQWLPLQNGENTIVWNQHCKIELCWRDIYKIGEW